jgi:predicted permease
MALIARVRSWIGAVFRRPALNREMNDELRLHVDLYAADLQRQGLSSADARRRARAELGGFDGQREQMRQSLGLRLLDELRGDIRHTFRTLRRSPGFAAVAVCSLALGIGANTAIFSLVDELILKRLPVQQPDRLFFIDNTGGKSGGNNAPPYPCFEILRDRNTHFAGIAMFDENMFVGNIDGNDEILVGQRASGNYFEVVGVRAALGRLLTPADDVPGAGGPDGPVVVISDALWKRRFGMSPSVLGRRIQIEKKPFTIVGVTPPGFFGLIVGGPIEFTIPVSQSGRNLSTRDSWWFSAIGRLADGARVEPARAELDAMFQTYMADLNGRPTKPTDTFNRIELVSAARGKHDVRKELSTPLVIVMATAGLVLLVGCANVASLLLARASARAHEMSLRLAIGASRGRLVRQLVTEGLVISSLGAAAGVVVAAWSATALTRMLGSTDQYIVLTGRVDVRALAFAGAVALLTGLLCSLVPALRATRPGQAAVGASGRVADTYARGVTGRALIVIQVTLSLVLLSLAALLTRTLVNLVTTDSGFRRDGVLLMPVRTTLPPPTSDEIRAELARVGAMWTNVAEQVRAVPGVRFAATASLTPLDRADRGVSLTIIGGPDVPSGARSIHLNQVTPEFFDTLGIVPLAGRLFDRRDTSASPRVAVLTAAAARQFGGSSPIGRSIRLTARSEPYEVVGVVPDAKYQSLRLDAERMAYVPMTQPMDRLGGATVLLRMEDSSRPAPLEVQRAIRDVVPGALITKTTTLDEQVFGSFLQERLVSTLASLFGALALTLACIGLYGLLSFTVTRRTREFGIRLAIGARRTTVVWLVLRETFVLVGAGLAAGLLVVYQGGRYLERLLFGITPGDPIALGGAAALLLLVALAAALLPARRASAINPMSALRHE